jgi:RNA polymerase sigma-70 factor, ECF subfamily
VEDKIHKEKSCISNHSSKDVTFEALIDEFEWQVTKYAYTYVKDWSTAQDITQEVFISIYNSIEEFKHDSNYKTWVFSITSNRCKDYLRSAYFRRTFLTSRFFERSSLTSPETSAIEIENQSEIIQLVFSLPIKYREVIILYYYEDFSTEEISELLNVKSSTIRTRLERARKKLKILQEGRMSHE